MRRLSADKRMQTGEMWGFCGNTALLSFVQGKTNLTKSALLKTEMVCKGAEIDGFVFFGGGKAYISTPNRRKTSTIPRPDMHQQKNICHEKLMADTLNKNNCAAKTLICAPLHLVEADFFHNLAHGLVSKI